MRVSKGLAILFVCACVLFTAMAYAAPAKTKAPTIQVPKKGTTFLSQTGEAFVTTGASPNEGRVFVGKNGLFIEMVVVKFDGNDDNYEVVIENPTTGKAELYSHWGNIVQSSSLKKMVRVMNFPDPITINPIPKIFVPSVLFNRADGVAVLLCTEKYSKGTTTIFIGKNGSLKAQPVLKETMDRELQTVQVWTKDGLLELPPSDEQQARWQTKPLSKVDLKGVAISFSKDGKAATVKTVNPKKNTK